VRRVANLWWEDDDQTAAMLGEALAEARAVPRDFIEAGKAAYIWRSFDFAAELAKLTYDSQREPVTTRTDTAAIRSLTFAAANLAIELEVGPDCLIGQVVPACVAEIELQTRTDSPETVTTDDLGCFTIRRRPSDAFRLRCRNDSADILTSWITL
jgi:hypothetical protein